MKYIIVENRYGGESAILFDEILDHIVVARQQDVVSAGFVTVKGIKNRWGDVNQTTCCWGGSMTLNTVSRKELDGPIVEKAIQPL